MVGIIPILAEEHGTPIVHVRRCLDHIENVTDVLYTSFSTP